MGGALHSTAPTHQPCEPVLNITWACPAPAGFQMGDALQLHTPTNRKGKSETDWVSSVLLDDLLRQYRGATDAAEAKVGRDFGTLGFSIWPIWGDLCEVSGRRHRPVFIAFPHRVQCTLYSSVAAALL